MRSKRKSLDTIRREKRLRRREKRQRDHLLTTHCCQTNESTMVKTEHSIAAAQIKIYTFVPPLPSSESEDSNPIDPLALDDLTVLPNEQADLQRGTSIRPLLEAIAGNSRMLYSEGIEVDGLKVCGILSDKQYGATTGIKPMEMTNATLEPSNAVKTEVEAFNQTTVDEEMDEKPAVDPASGLLFCRATRTAAGGRNVNQELMGRRTVYKSEGDSISDKSSLHPASVDHLSFHTDEEAEIMSIPTETLLSCEPIEYKFSATMNLDEKTSSQAKLIDIHVKQLDKILSESLPKTVGTYGGSSEDESSALIANSLALKSNSDDGVAQHSGILSGEQIKLEFS